MMENNYWNVYFIIAIELTIVSSETNESYNFPGKIFELVANPSLEIYLENQKRSWIQGNKITLPPSVFHGKYVTILNIYFAMISIALNIFQLERIVKDYMRILVTLNATFFYNVEGSK